MSSPRLLDEVRISARLRHLSLKTEKAYLQQIKRFILFHNKRHPCEMNAKHIRDYLSHLAVERMFLPPHKMSRSQRCSFYLEMFSNKGSIGSKTWNGLGRTADCLTYTHVLNRGGRGVRSPLDT